MDGLRPTAERIRETLFNWLAPTIAGSRCLDLCAGTGALGFEALSRGAREAVFVEKSPLAARVLRANALMLDADGADIRQGDALEFLGDSPDAPFDIVFLDPPFAAAMHGELCRLLDEHAWVRPGSLVYIEEDRAAPPAELPAGWTLTRSRTAGKVRYSLAKAGNGA